MPTLSISQIETDDQINAVRGLVREFTDFAWSQNPDAKNSHSFEGLEEQLAELPGIFGPPDGAFLLATVDGAPAGCVAFFSHGEGMCEVKRMYVRPAYRGLQLGEKLVQKLIERARSQGYSKITLNTFHTLKAAQQLYAKAGFTVCKATINLSADYDGKVIFMEMYL